MDRKDIFFWGKIRLLLWTFITKTRSLLFRYTRSLGDTGHAVKLPNLLWITLNSILRMTKELLVLMPEVNLW